MAEEDPAQKCSKTVTPAKKEFLSVYKRIRDEVVADPMLSQGDAQAWMVRMMDYNVPGGKLNRGMSVKDTLLAIDSDASPELRFQADCLGWAIEFLQVQLRHRFRPQTCSLSMITLKHAVCRHIFLWLMILWTNQLHAVANLAGIEWMMLEWSQSTMASS